MDIKFIHQSDSKPAYDATAIDEIGDALMPADTMRDFFVRLGNVSGSKFLGLPITVEGQHPSRITMSFDDRKPFQDLLMINELADGSSQNLYIRLTMPVTQTTENVASYIVIGEDRLTVSYRASQANISRADPYPDYGDNEFTDSMFELFAGKEVLRFTKHDPVENPPGSYPKKTGKLKFADFEFCNRLDPNDHERGYEEPIVADLPVIVAPREINDEDVWTYETTLDYSDGANIFLPADFFVQLGGTPVWRLFHVESFGGGDIVGAELHKRSQILLFRDGVTYHVDRIHHVQRGQELCYWKGVIRIVRDAVSMNKYRYNPFCNVYEENSDIVVRRYACQPKIDIETVAFSSSSGDET